MSAAHTVLSRNCRSHAKLFVFLSLQEHPEATLTLSLAQTVFCRKHGFDPQSPLCVHIMLSGTVTKVSSDFHEKRWAWKNIMVLETRKESLKNNMQLIC